MLGETQATLDLEGACKQQDAAANQLNNRGVVQGKKKWGPISVTRHSQRVDLKGKTMTERAQELKKKQTMEIPTAKGISTSNNLSLLQSDKFIEIADSAGVDITDVDIPISGEDMSSKALVLPADLSSPHRTVNNRFFFSF